MCIRDSYYKVPVEKYKKLMFENVTKLYKRGDDNLERTTNLKMKQLADQLDIADRIDILAPQPPYIKLKDHKRNFRQATPCRLINPCKTEIGKISKQILDRINKELVTKTRANQWKSTNAVLEWFKNVPTEDNSTFIIFDIINYYPSISKELLCKAIQFAEMHTEITPLEKEIIYEAKNSILFHDNKPWIKKDGNGAFDVTMGSWDGAETCELIGTYLSLIHI